MLCPNLLLSDRKKKTLEAWFDQLVPDQRSAIQVVCIDMWDVYCSAVQTQWPGVEIVVNRFHVMKNLNHALTTARREIQRPAAPGVKDQLKDRGIASCQAIVKLIIKSTAN